jgi:FtsP/CotA-like multicopper oxidase with cupredoxin domain
MAGLVVGLTSRTGTPLILERGEPVAITVINRLPRAISVHWHGVELESYFDGVADWSGEPGRTAPASAPADSFTARFPPLRAGTFIHHVHMDSRNELGSGLYGPLLVFDAGTRFDAETTNQADDAIAAAYFPKHIVARE